MKYSIVILGLAMMFTGSCNNRIENKSGELNIVINDSPDHEVHAGTTADNSSNSLDWEGTYIGTIPCADCEGIETSITLNKDLSYSVIKKYLGKKDTVAARKTGLFSWNKGGNIITLLGMEGTTGQYQVGENMLIQLDTNGKRITGYDELKYQLKKTVQ